MFYIKFVLLIISVITLINGCSRQIYSPSRMPSSGMISAFSTPSMVLVNQPYSKILNGDDLSPKSLKTAINSSLIYLNRISPYSIFQFGKMRYTATEMIASFNLFVQVIDNNYKYDELIDQLEEKFYIFKSSANDDDQVMFTGYYEPIFQGNLKRTKEYNIPVYSNPDDLKVLELGDFRHTLKNRTIVYRLYNNKILPYYTRQQIMSGKVLAGKKQEIAWMKDPVDLFFMQIQGSGILELPSGKKIRLSYDGSNGHRYSSIGRKLVEDGKMKLDEVSMSSIREYLRANPTYRDTILYYNKSYTFFKLNNELNGPVGNINVPLTKNRSIAVDTNIFPKGALAYIRSNLPIFEKDWDNHSVEPFSRFALIQDTGGAIKGPGRVDLFWGNGELAEKSAGTMRSFGRLYFIIAKKDAISEFISEDQPSD